VAREEIPIEDNGAVTGFFRVPDEDIDVTPFAKMA
jgi:hypothetical protein